MLLCYNYICFYAPMKYSILIILYYINHEELFIHFIFNSETQHFSFFHLSSKHWVCSSKHLSAFFFSSISLFFFFLLFLFGSSLPFLISRFILFSLFFLQWGSSALMKASVNGHLEVVRLLLDRGANIDVVNNVNYIFIFWFISGFEFLY